MIGKIAAVEISKTWKDCPMVRQLRFHGPDYTELADGLLHLYGEAPASLVTLQHLSPALLAQSVDKHLEFALGQDCHSYLLVPLEYSHP